MGQTAIQWRSIAKAGGETVVEQPVVPPVSQTKPPEQDDGFRAQALKLLRSPGVQVDQHATLDGRPAIRIASADGRTVYFVAPGTFTPLELRTRGTTGGVTLQFRAFRQLADTPENRRLLSLTAQHPGATVDSDPDDYDAAEARLYPHG
jgi:hypothetical protein